MDKIGQMIVNNKENDQVKPNFKIKISDNANMLLQLLNNGMNNRDICKILHLDDNQLYQELLNLKNLGILFSKKYYFDGSIKYDIIHTLEGINAHLNNSIDHQQTIITNVNQNNMKILAISDLHFGNKKERLDLIDRAYNYCKKNDIHIIFCGGDILDGSFTRGVKNIKNLYKQVEYFIDKYPRDDSILTFSVAGNHDISIFNDTSLDIIRLCENYRHDVVIAGYNNAIINIKNDKIHLYHHIENGKFFATAAMVRLHGHSHKYRALLNNNKLDVVIPSLSSVNNSMPSALEINFDFEKGYIANAVIKHLYFGKMDEVLGVDIFDLTSIRNIGNNQINNVEEYTDGQNIENNFIDVNTRKRKALSQIEKFNKKYNL